MAESELKLVFGHVSIDTRYGFDAPDRPQGFLNTLAELGINTIDIAFIYGDFEELLGEVNVASRLMSDTKFPGGFSPDSSAKEEVIQTGKQSLQRLNTTNLGII
jgi:aryl-alcohol dehydrogenase-like predicted oxidoreductase